MPTSKSNSLRATAVCLIFFSFLGFNTTAQNFNCDRFNKGETQDIDTRFIITDFSKIQSLVSYYRDLKWVINNENNRKILSLTNNNPPQSSAQNKKFSRPVATTDLIRKHFPESYWEDFRACNGNYSNSNLMISARPPYSHQDEYESYVEKEHKKYLRIANSCERATRAINEFPQRVEALRRDMQTYCTNLDQQNQQKEISQQEQQKNQSTQSTNNSSSNTSSSSDTSSSSSSNSSSNSSSSSNTNSSSTSNSNYNSNQNTNSGYSNEASDPGVNIQQYNSFENRVQSPGDYYFDKAMKDYEIFNNAEVDFSAMREAEIRYSNFKDGLKIDNTLTPQGMLSEYRQNLREIDAYYAQETKRVVANILAEGAKNANVKGAGLVTAAATAAAIALRKEEEKKAKKKLAEEMEREFKKIQKKLLDKEEPKLRSNQQKASGAVTREQEDFYMGWADYWSCRVNRIKKQFSIKNTDWIDPNCNTPRNTSVPNGPSMQSASGEQLYAAANRKNNSSLSFMNKAPNSFLKGALKKDPKNVQYLYTAYLWSKRKSKSISTSTNSSSSNTTRRTVSGMGVASRSSSTGYTAGLDKPIDYLHKILAVDTKNPQAREALRYELAVKDRDRESYASYVDKYQAGMYISEAKYAVQYFDNINRLNSLIESSSLEAAVDLELKVSKDYPDFYRKNDVVNRGRLSEVYDERDWNSLKGRSFSGKYRQKIDSELSAYNSYLKKHPNALHKDEALTRIEYLEAKLKADRTKLLYTLSLVNNTTIDGYASGSNGYAPYQYNGISFVNRLNMGFSKRIMVAHLGGDKFIGGFGKIDFTLMGNLAKKINEDIGAADFGDFSQFNPTMFYHSPAFNLSVGITLSDFLDVYVTARSRPELGNSVKEEDKLFYETDGLYDPRFNLDEPPFQPGFGARLQIPFDKSGKNYAAVRYEMNSWKGDTYNSSYTLIEAKVILFGGLMIGAHSGTYVPFVDGQDRFNLTAQYLTFNVGAEINMSSVGAAYR